MPAATRPLFQLSNAQQLAEAGMACAMDHADSVICNWSDRAYVLLCEYAATHSEFMTEDARYWAGTQGLPPAPSARAWGALALRASRENVIFKAGYRRTQNPTAHGTPATLWRSLRAEA